MRDVPMKPLSVLLTLVTDRVSGNKDSSEPYVGLEHMPSAGSALLAAGSANDSISTNGVFIAGDILFGKLRPRLRKSVRVAISGYCSTDILVLRPTGNTNPAYAGFLAQSDVVFSAAIRTEEGTKMPRCSWQSIKNVNVFLPDDKNIQKKIAAILTSIDTTIEKTEALIAKYQQIKAGLMRDLFTRGVLPDGNLRPPREQAPELYQETMLGWIPREWRITTLSACLTENPTNGIYKSADLIGEGSIMVGQTAFTPERSIDFSLCRRGSINSDEIRRYCLRKDDILVTRVFATLQGVGLPTLVPELPELAVFESNMMRLRVDATVALPRLLFEWLRGASARRFIHGGANASNQSSVNQSVLNPMPVSLPSLEEQAQIVTIINRIDQRQSVERETLSKLQHQKLGLMQDLLTGKVPVEPAPEPLDTTDA